MVEARNRNIALYAGNLFGRYDPAGNRREVAELQGSGFTTVMLFTLHVDSEASLYYNGTPIVKNGIFANFDYLPNLLADLKSNGSVQRVLFSIGCANALDFATMGTLLQTNQAGLLQSFGALQAALPIDGVDFDDESTYNAETDATLSHMLATPANFSMTVTYCPYTEQSVWNTALQDTWQLDLQSQTPLPQSVRWWNLQCYGGADPVQWAKGVPSNAGVADPYSLVVPIYSATEDTPETLQQTFEQLAGHGFTNGGLWNMTNIAPQYSLQQYADAIIEGLESGPTG